MFESRLYFKIEIHKNCISIKIVKGSETQNICKSIEEQMLQILNINIFLVAITAFFIDNLWKRSFKVLDYTIRRIPS